MATSRRKQLLGVNIDDISLAETLSLSESWLREPGFHQIVTTGPEFILEAQDNPEFRRVLNSADLSIPDGMGVKVGFALSGRRHRHRISGVDYVLGLMSLAAHQRRSVFLLGAREGVAELAAAQLLKAYPGLSIAGIECDHRWPWTPLTDQRLTERIHLAKPDILLVALGAPKQDLWIYRHRHALHHVRIAVGVGRTFDYLAGTIQRPPAWIRRLGMEWLHTYLRANSFRGQIGTNPKLRRHRVEKATWHFIKAVITH